MGPVGGCEQGWYKLLDRCYMLGGRAGGNDMLTWYDAQTECANAPGGHLAEIYNSGLQGEFAGWTSSKP